MANKYGTYDASEAYGGYPDAYQANPGDYQGYPDTYQGYTGADQGYDVQVWESQTGEFTTNTEEEAETDDRQMCYLISLVALFLLVFCVAMYALSAAGIFGDSDDDLDAADAHTYLTIPGNPGGGKPPSTTPGKPKRSDYHRADLQGLICHSSYHNVVGKPVTKSCDFAIVDIETGEPHARTGDTGANIPLIPGSIAPLFAHLWGNDIFRIILSHKGSLLRQTDKATLPQILRGLRQIIVDNNAHGVALGWSVLHEGDLHSLFDHAKHLSEEMDEYHGLLRYDTYSGDRQSLTEFIIKVGRLRSMTVLYQVSGLTKTFTNPYFPNFYLSRFNEKPLMTLIDEEVVEPIKAAGGNVKVAITMSLLARSCPAGTVYGGNTDALDQCVSEPLDTTKICQLLPAYIQGHYYSLMTRRYNGGSNSDLTEDVFFETQYTVPRKAYHMLAQLKDAKVPLLAFVIERSDLDLQESVVYTDHFSKKVNCSAQPLGILESTKREIMGLLQQTK